MRDNKLINFDFSQLKSKDNSDKQKSNYKTVIRKTKLYKCMLKSYKQQIKILPV